MIRALLSGGAVAQDTAPHQRLLAERRQWSPVGEDNGTYSPQTQDESDVAATALHRPKRVRAAKATDEDAWEPRQAMFASSLSRSRTPAIWWLLRAALPSGNCGRHGDLSKSESRTAH